MNERVEEIMATIAIETLERLSFIFSSTAEENNGLDSDLMAACVSFKGPFSGRLVMKMASSVVLELTANMLGIDEDAATTDQQSDAIKEAINVICGNLLPAIGGKQVIFNIKTPEILYKENGEEDTVKNEIEPLAVTRLSIDDELCELYLFVDGDVSL